MPSRRSILATGSLAAGAAFAGCSALTGPPGTDATIRGGSLDVPEAPSAPVVARAESESDGHGCPEGKLRVSARVHEVSRSGGRVRLVLVTEWDVYTGRSWCENRWGQTGIAVHNDWRIDTTADDGHVTSRQSNVVPTGDSRKQATLERDHTAGTGNWRVHLTPPTRGTVEYRFASTFAGGAPPTEGDVLVRTRAEAQVRNGWLGGSDALGTRVTLTYGETDR